jgi:hypothetical protein
MAHNRPDDDLAYGEGGYYGQGQGGEGQEGERGFIGDVGRKFFGGSKPQGQVSTVSFTGQFASRCTGAHPHQDFPLLSFQPICPHSYFSPIVLTHISSLYVLDGYFNILTQK